MTAITLYCAAPGCCRVVSSDHQHVMLCVVAAGCQHPCQGGVDCTGQRGQRGGNRRGRCFKGARQLLGCGALLVLALARGPVVVAMHSCSPVHPVFACVAPAVFPLASSHVACWYGTPCPSFNYKNLSTVWLAAILAARYCMYTLVQHVHTAPQVSCLVGGVLTLARCPCCCSVP